MHRTLQDILWLGPAVIELFVAVHMLRRRILRQYSVFWSYLVLDVLRTTILFSIGNDAAHYREYFYVFWISEIPACLLAFLAVFELFRDAFSPRLGLSGRGVALFRLLLCTLFATAAVIAFVSPGSDANRLIAGVIIIKRAESLVLFGLWAALFVLVFGMGLPWGNYAVGIAAGFAVNGATEVASWALRAYYGRTLNHYFVWSLLVGGFCQALLWAAYILRAQHHIAVQSGDFSACALRSHSERLREQIDVLLERRW